MGHAASPSTSRKGGERGWGLQLGTELKILSLFSSALASLTSRLGPRGGAGRGEARTGGRLSPDVPRHAAQPGRPDPATRYRPPALAYSRPTPTRSLPLTYRLLSLAESGQALETPRAALKRCHDDRVFYPPCIRPIRQIFKKRRSYSDSIGDLAPLRKYLAGNK